MAKDRDWLDYANVGSNLFQNLQLSGVQSKLGAMASAAASEQAKTEYEDMLREAVFQADTNLKGLRAHVDAEKTGVLAVATFTLANFERYNLTSASFRSFEDKERLRSVLEGFKSLVDQCSSTLSIAERTEAQMCAQYMEDPAVIASAPSELAQQLGRARRELSELAATEQRGTSASRKFLVPLVVATVGTILGFILLVAGSEIGVVVWVTFAIALVVTIAAKLMYKPDPQIRKQSEEATRLKSVKAEEIKALQQRVDSEVAKERIRLEKERDALMAKVLKVGKTNAQSSTNQATAQTRFDVVLISIPVEREQREILAVVISQLSPHQTTPRFKELLKGGTALEPSLPVKIVTGVARADAVTLANKLKKAGAKVEIENEQPD